MHDIVIRGGTIVDGSGEAPFIGDIAIDSGRISAVGSVSGAGREEIDAAGQIVTPRFVDIHTHYAGPATLAVVYAPSSWHGVPTGILGNRAVGFPPGRHDRPHRQ